MSDNDPLNELAVYALQEIERVKHSFEQTVDAKNAQIRQQYGKDAMPSESIVVALMMALETNFQQRTDEQGPQSYLNLSDAEYIPQFSLHLPDVMDMKYRYSLTAIDELIALGVRPKPYGRILLMSNTGHEPEKKPLPRYLRLFLRAFIVDIQRQICGVTKRGGSKSKSATQAGVLASVSAYLVDHLGIGSELATGIAAAVILLLLSAGKNAFCSLPAEELLKRVDRPPLMVRS